jgi:hypothetical protein
MTLVSILGDFHSSILPISFEFKERITKHIIVYDDARHDVKKSWRILRGQKVFMESLSSNSKNKYEIVTMQIDEDNYESISECFERILTMVSSPEKIYLNTTDGLSSIAIVLSSKFLDAGAKIISYDRYANTYNLHTANGMEKHTVKHNMDIASHLLLKGYRLLEVTDKHLLQQRKDVIMELTKDLTRFKEFTNLLQNKKLDDIAGYANYKKLLQSINTKDQKFIQGVVFEEYIYHLITDNFDFDDVWTGVKVKFEEMVENEFDILMIKDNHLHTIECKLVNKLDGKHFVYKTELIMEYLDDDGKAMILSVGADNVKVISKKKKQTQFTLGDRARANFGDINIHQCRVFDEKAFLDDIREWFL